MLITGINSDLAGDILAQVSRDVYSSDQRALVIPKGTFENNSHCAKDPLYGV
jgi:type IV secretory pathway VirB10-like protein